MVVYCLQVYGRNATFCFAQLLINAVLLYFCQLNWAKGYDEVLSSLCVHFVVSSVIICVSYFSHLIIFLTLTKIGRNVTWTVIIIYFCIKIFKSFWKCNMAARPIMFSKIYIYKKKN